MFVIPLISHKNTKRRNMVDTISEIREGNQHLRESFIKDHIPYIIKTASKVLGKYVEMENSEEYSIALLAFNEAINTFDKSKSDNFWFYSDMLIKRKIIDFFRHNKKNDKVYPFTYFEKSEQVLQYHLNRDNDIRLFEDVDANDELMLFKSNLNSFGISLDDLLLNSPKHKDSIRLCIKMARFIVDNESMYKQLKKKKTIPTSELVKHLNVHIRTVERNRKFIIALCLILKSNLDVMKGFIQYTEKGGVQE